MMDIDLGMAIECRSAEPMPSPLREPLREALNLLHRSPSMADDPEVESLLRQITQRTASTVGGWNRACDVPRTDWFEVMERVSVAATGLLAARAASSPWEGLRASDADEIRRLAGALLAVAKDIDKQPVESLLIGIGATEPVANLRALLEAGEKSRLEMGKEIQRLYALIDKVCAERDAALGVQGSP